MALSKQLLLVTSCRCASSLMETTERLPAAVAKARLGPAAECRSHSMSKMAEVSKLLSLHSSTAPFALTLKVYNLQVTFGYCRGIAYGVSCGAIATSLSQSNHCRAPA